MLPDLMMLVRSGTATIRAVRRLAPHLQIIATSGLLGEERGREVAQAGAQVCLSKPYTAEPLWKTRPAVFTAN